MDLKEAGEEIHQETRLYDSTKNQTFSMRKKENAHDYRYFPDPDLLPVIVEQSWIENIKNNLPELPLKKAERFQQEYGLPEYDAFVLTTEREMAEYFETTAKACGNAKSASNWIMVELLRRLNDADQSIEDSPIKAEMLAKLIQLIDKKTISGKI